MSLELLQDVFFDCVKDTLQLVPFLLITYLVMETIEHSTEGRAERIIRSAGASGPLVGGLLGALPQCGFSAMAGTLYAGRIITAGTLVAVILSTSDELIPVFLAHQAPMPELVSLVAVKVVIGVVVGFAAETNDLEHNAAAKLASKGCDMIVANDVSRAESTFGSDTNRVTLVTPDGSEQLELMSKDDVAHAIVCRVAGLLAQGSSEGA